MLNTKNGCMGLNPIKYQSLIYQNDIRGSSKEVEYINKSYSLGFLN